VERRATAYDVQTALSAASVQVKNAMKDAVTTSIEEYKKIMDFFASRLKLLFQKANFKGSKIYRIVNWVFLSTMFIENLQIPLHAKCHSLIFCHRCGTSRRRH
jgi:hypothetical protein